MSRVVVAGIVEFPPEVRDEALIKGKELIEGAVPASDLFKQWAEISGQGGYDEASGVKE